MTQTHAVHLPAWVVTLVANLRYRRGIPRARRSPPHLLYRLTSPTPTRATTTPIFCMDVIRSLRANRAHTIVGIGKRDATDAIASEPIVDAVAYSIVPA